MAGKSLYLNPKTRDYVNIDGSLANINALLVQIYSSIVTPKGSWWADRTFGTQAFDSVNQPMSKFPITQIMRTIEVPIRQMYQTQRIRKYSVSYLSRDTVSGNYIFKIDVTDNTGNPLTFDVSLEI